jgi:thiol-disulfide isomerase/thioredoxin
MKKYILIVLSLMLIFLTACGAKQESSNPTNNNTESSGLLSNFTATDLSGQNIDESVFSDYDLTMINVWATFCGPCLNEMPDLGELSREYKSEGVQIAGMVSDVLDSSGAVDSSQISTAKDIVSQTNADYLHIVPSQDLFDLLYQIQSVPTTFFVDKDGNQVGEVYVGSKSKEDWEIIINQTLSEVK